MNYSPLFLSTASFLFYTSIYCSLVLASFILAGVQGRLKIGFIWVCFRFQPQVDEGYIDIPVCATTYCSCDVMWCVWKRERAGKSERYFLAILRVLRKPCCFLFCLEVPHNLASSLCFHCKWAESHFCHPVEFVLTFWEIFVKKVYKTSSKSAEESMEYTHQGYHEFRSFYIIL